MSNTDMTRINRVAQWAFDTRPILGRFHLWLEDVDIEVETRDKSESADSSISLSIVGPCATNLCFRLC